jgi:uncharacterized protein (DUF952 family)
VKTEKHIFHIFERTRWVAALAGGEYTPEGFEKEGFIHLSSKHQLKGTAEKYYRAQAGLGVLKVDIGRLKAPLKYENLSGGEDLFPHLYGPLNIDAVTQIVFLGLTHEGEFLWPDELF